MRPSRLLRELKKTTGIVGLPVHHNAREELSHLYQKIQFSLERLPSDYTYKVGTQALVKQRLDIVENHQEVAEIEQAIGVGQIEQLILQARGELQLIDILEQDKPWQPLQEQAPQERLIGSSDYVDMNAILHELQHKVSHAQVSRPGPPEYPVFDWKVIRFTLLEDAEQLASNVESIYHFAYQYFRGNSVLHAKHYESVLMNIQLASLDLEGSCYIAALWMGHLNWNANGHLLSGLLGMIRSIKNMLQTMTVEHQTEKVSRMRQKTMFLLKKVQTMFQFKMNPLKSINALTAQEIRREARVFVDAVDIFLGYIEQTDDTLYLEPYKNSSEISLLLHHFERLNGVKFPTQTLQYQFYPTVGRYSTHIKYKPMEGYHPNPYGQNGGLVGQPAYPNYQARTAAIDDIDVGQVPKEPTNLEKAHEAVVLSDDTLTWKPRSSGAKVQKDTLQTNDTFGGTSPAENKTEQDSNRSMEQTESAPRVLPGVQMVQEPQSIDQDNESEQKSKWNQLRKSIRSSAVSRSSLPNAYNLLAKHLDSLDELNNRSKKSILT